MRAWVSQNAATVLFASAVVLLIALTGWWFVFLQRSVNGQYDLAVENLALSARLHAASLSAQPTLQEGPIPGDPRLHVCPAAKTPAGAEVEPPVKAYYDGDLLVAAHVRGSWWLCTDVGFRASLRSRKTRISAMLFGEGLLLTGLMLAVIAMLYRLVRSERRFRAEMEGFLRRVTHEMKTPIAGIKAVLQTIQLGRMPEDKLKGLTARALREADREEHLIQNLLVAQRLRHDGSNLRRDPLDVAELLLRLTASRQAVSGELTWQVEATPGLVVAADASALRTILDNLLDNATKYGEGEIRVRVGTADEQAVVVISDDGVGFDPAAAGDLFVPFVRSADSNAASRKGTGLGLSISQQLATAMGGGIEAQSDGEGRGARFTLTLPLWSEGA